MCLCRCLVSHQWTQNLLRNESSDEIANVLQCDAVLALEGDALLSPSSESESESESVFVQRMAARGIPILV